jgi:hypothetical protein
MAAELPGRLTLDASPYYFIGSSEAADGVNPIADLRLWPKSWPFRLWVVTLRHILDLLQQGINRRLDSRIDNVAPTRLLARGPAIRKCVGREPASPARNAVVQLPDDRSQAAPRS